MTALTTTPTSTVVGLSVGTATLAAVTADRTVTSRPVVVRAGHPIDDFVTRVGDPVGIVAADGSLHSAAALLADALHELARSAAAGRPVPAAATVAYPAHWKPVAVDALGRALRRIPVWSGGPELVPDSAAALAALQPHGLPSRGVVAVCDVGASATTITLVDAGDRLRPIGEPVRCGEFSGDLIDRGLLSHVLTAAGIGPDATGTWSIRALTALRGECRSAKERLSAQTVTTVPGAPAGLPGSIRITRAEVDELVVGPLSEVVGVVRDSLQRNGIQVGEFVAVAVVGGMAAVPAVAATLSDQLRVPIITTASPALAAASGAALGAAKQVAEPGAGAVTRVQRAAARPATGQQPLAWSQAGDVPEIVPQQSVWAKRRPVRPQLDFASPPAVRARTTSWHRRPLVLAALVLAVIAGAGAATVVALRADTNAAPAARAVNPAPVSPATQTGSPRTVVAVPASGADQSPAPQPAAPVMASPTAAPPPDDAGEPAPPAPSPSAPAPAVDAAPEALAPAQTQAPAPAQTQAPAMPTIPPLPPLPQIPIPQIPGLPDLPTLFASTP